MRRSDGFVYKGNFENDLKHGDGEILYPNGEKIVCKWENDRIHGVGYFSDAKGKKTKATWYYDLMIPFDKSNTNCFDLMPLNLFFILAMATFIILAIILKQPLFFIGTGIFYLAQLIEGCCVSTGKFLRNIESTENTHKIIDTMRYGPPSISFTIQNYHHELRTRVVTRTVRDAQGNSRTETHHETYWHRVNTHYAKQNFRYI